MLLVFPSLKQTSNEPRSVMLGPGNLNLAIESRVYIDYDRGAAPPHPGKTWTRFVCISDTHSRCFKIPSGDVLLHAGDLSSWGYADQLDLTMAWLKSLEHPMKIIIAGNHDLCLDKELSEGEQALLAEGGDSPEDARLKVRSQALQDAGIHYLEHESFNFTSSSGRQWKVYGSPAAPKYRKGAFQYKTTHEAEAIYGQIPPDTEILLTHTPPHLTLDETRRGKHAGCEQLAESMKRLEACRLHVFGHIHDAHGAQIEPSHRVSVNAAMCLGAQPIIVDLRN